MLYISVKNLIYLKMKKTVQILFAAMMVFFVYNASGQVKFQKGDALINLGVGAGY